MNESRAFTYKTFDVPKYKEALNSIKDKMLQRAAKGLWNGMRQFEGHIITKMLSGRSRTSLGRVTGYAARSWHLTPYATSFGDIFIVKLNTSAPYLRVHQTGSKDWDGTFNDGYRSKKMLARVTGIGKVERQIGAPKRHNIPKRLHIYEDFKDIGQQMLIKGVQDEVTRGRYFK
jgi:hypothetical protein